MAVLLSAHGDAFTGAHTTTASGGSHIPALPDCELTNNLTYTQSDTQITVPTNAHRDMPKGISLPRWGNRQLAHRLVTREAPCARKRAEQRGQRNQRRYRPAVKRGEPTAAKPAPKSPWYIAIEGVHDRDHKESRRDKGQRNKAEKKIPVVEGRSMPSYILSRSSLSRIHSALI